MPRVHGINVRDWQQHTRINTARNRLSIKVPRQETSNTEPESLDPKARRKEPNHVRTLQKRRRDKSNRSRTISPTNETKEDDIDSRADNNNEELQPEARASKKKRTHQRLYDENAIPRVQ